MSADVLSLLQDRGLSVLPYGNAWWIFGHGVSRVVADLDGVQACDLEPLPVFER